MEESVKMYIAGRVSGINYNYAKRKFNKAEKYNRGKGWNVINPTKICKKEWSWLRCMIVCLWYLMKCDAVYFLRNYKNSKGAIIEYKIAKLLGKLMYFE